MNSPTLYKLFDEDGKELERQQEGATSMVRMLVNSIHNARENALIQVFKQIEGRLPEPMEGANFTLIVLPFHGIHTEQVLYNNVPVGLLAVRFTGPNAGVVFTPSQTKLPPKSVPLNDV